MPKIHGCKNRFEKPIIYFYKKENYEGVSSPRIVGKKKRLTCDLLLG